MRSNVFREARIGLLVLALILLISLLFYFFASMFTSMGYSGLRFSESASTDDKTVIVLDAGHGGEDPGAVANGLIEKELNLEISQTIFSLLQANGYTAVSTRNDDTLLYNSGQENKKKYYDLRNREAIANEYRNSIFISLHMNKFPMQSCKGLQVFYSSNNELSYRLAQSVQNSAKILQSDNKREVKEGNESIYLLENLKMPSVLIECGFISNDIEAEMLESEEYRTALALTIYCGVAEFLEGL